MRRRSAVAVLLALGLALPGAGAPALETTATRQVPSALSPAEARRAGQWGLESAEWQRYQSLMAGPRGLWSPDLDPLMVLGIHARSDAERRRYAELAVRQERARVEGELAFGRAYQAAWQRLYADEPLIDPALLPRAQEATALPALRPGDRLLFFTDAACAPCSTLLPRLLARVRQAPGAGLDIYLTDSAAGGDAAVRAWAQAQAIPPALVRSQVVTLNHDRGTLARLAAGAAAPALLLRRDERLHLLSRQGAP